MSQYSLSTEATAVHYSKPTIAQSNGIEIVYDSFGHSDAPPLLLTEKLAAFVSLFAGNHQRAKAVSFGFFEFSSAL